jgi:hypothetical protein
MSGIAAVSRALLLGLTLGPLDPGRPLATLLAIGIIRILFAIRPAFFFGLAFWPSTLATGIIGMRPAPVLGRTLRLIPLAIGIIRVLLTVGPTLLLGLTLRSPALAAGIRRILTTPFFPPATTLLIVRILFAIQTTFILAHTAAGSRMFLTILGMLLTPLLATTHARFVVGVVFAVGAALLVICASPRARARRSLLTLRPVGVCGTHLSKRLGTLLLVSGITAVSIALLLGSAAAGAFNSAPGGLKAHLFSVRVTGTKVIRLRAIDLALG